MDFDVNSNINAQSSKHIHIHGNNDLSILMHYFLRHTPFQAFTLQYFFKLL